MSFQAIGTLETIGYVSAYVAADAMVKSADVSIIGRDVVATGHVAVTVSGDVGAVRAAIEAGVDAVSPAESLVAAHVIARPGGDLQPHFVVTERALRSGAPAVSVVTADQKLGAE